MSPILVSRRHFLQSLLAVGGSTAFQAVGIPLPLPFTSPHQFTLDQTIDFRPLLGRTLDYNVLKLFRAVVDPTRQRAYVAGIMTPHLGILDTATNTWLGTVDSQISPQDGTTHKYLTLDIPANRLYIYDERHTTLRGIDLETGTLLGVGQAAPSLGAVWADSQRGLVYLLATEAPNFRAYDGVTLQQVYTNSDLGERAHEMVYDATQDRLLVLSGAEGQGGQIISYDPNTRQVIETIQFSLFANQRARHFVWDSDHQQFLVLAGGVILTLAADGREVGRFELPRNRQPEALAYNSVTQHGLVLTLDRPQNGEVESVNGRLTAFDPTTGQQAGEVAFGKKVHSMAVDEGSGSIYFPNGDAGTVWHVPADYSTATPLRLGDSLEQVLPVLGGRMLIMNSRLGGSYLMAYDVETGTLETFQAGMWCIPMRTDAAGETLFILNAWESSLSVFGLNPTRTLLKTIPIGLPVGSTDRLPDLAVGSRFAYAAYPEFGQVAVVDWITGATVTQLKIEGVEGGSETGGGPGQLQVTVNEATQRVFVYANPLRGEGQLHIYDMTNHTLLQTITMPRERFSSLGGNVDLLFMDTVNNRLFVRHWEVDAATGELTGRHLESGARVFGYDPTTDLYWSNGDTENGQQAIVSLAASNLGVVERWQVAATEATPPQFALDASRQRIYVGYMSSVRVDFYHIGA